MKKKRGFLPILLFLIIILITSTIMRRQFYYQYIPCRIETIDNYYLMLHGVDSADGLVICTWDTHLMNEYNYKKGDYVRVMIKSFSRNNYPKNFVLLGKKIYEVESYKKNTIL